MDSNQNSHHIYRCVAVLLTAVFMMAFLMHHHVFTPRADLVIASTDLMRGETATAYEFPYNRLNELAGVRTREHEGYKFTVSTEIKPSEEFKDAKRVTYTISWSNWANTHTQTLSVLRAKE